MIAFIAPRLKRRIRDGTSSGLEAAIAAGAILGKEVYHADVMARGGAGFVQRLKKYGRTKNNEPLVQRRWFLETCEAIGDMRIGRVISTGCSRSGKSLSNILCSVDQLVAGAMEIGYIYADMSSRDANSATEWRPVAEYWVKAIEDEVGASLASREDVKTVKSWQLRRISAHFRYAGTPAASTTGKPSMGNAATGYTAHCLYPDEFSQYPPGISFRSRLNDSIFGSMPERPIGTPGAGAGIEVFTRDLDHYFIPHYHCHNCGAEKPLDPYGCLLLPKTLQVGGKMVNSYLNNSNRPLDWWSLDESDPIATAVICCSDCGTPIPEVDRTENAWMRCRDTGLDLRDYLDSVDDDVSKTRKIGLHFSPLCRENRPNIAKVLIEEGLNEERPAADWVQQDLGWPTEPKGETLTIPALKPLLTADRPKPPLTPRWTIAGVDCGRGQHWLWIMDVYPPSNWQRILVGKTFRKSIRVVRFAGPVNQWEIEGLLDKYQVGFGIIDNEPSRAWVAQLCDRTVLEMADQKGRSAVSFEKKTVRDGGEDFPCWLINSSNYKQAVIDSAVGLDDLAAWDDRSAYRFPADWDKFLLRNSENSPLRHLCAVKFDPIEQKWIRPRDSIDDIFFAAHFAEAALEIAISEGCNDGDIQW